MCRRCASEKSKRSTIRRASAGSSFWIAASSRSRSGSGWRSCRRSQRSRLTRVARSTRTILAPPAATLHGKPPSSSGLGRRPFTPVARVRIPLGVFPPKRAEVEDECQGFVDRAKLVRFEPPGRSSKSFRVDDRRLFDEDSSLRTLNGDLRAETRGERVG